MRWRVLIWNRFWKHGAKGGAGEQKAQHAWGEVAGGVYGGVCVRTR